jgi:hypothetical protein
MEVQLTYGFTISASADLANHQFFQDWVVSDEDTNGDGADWPRSFTEGS